MSYVDGFVLPIHPDKLDAYRENTPMPFDGKRMIFGGFDPVVVLEKNHG